VRGRVYPVRLWDRGRDQPLTGGSVGIDTETTLIQSPYETPELVIMQVSDGTSVDIVPWEQAGGYLQAMAEAAPGMVVYMLNAAFDLRVLDSEALWAMLADGRVVDIAMRSVIYKTATVGYFDEKLSLERLVGTYLKFKLEKPADIRLGFTRDMTLNRQDIQYAAMDALATHQVAMAIPEQPTEALQTRAAVALDEVRINGMLVDRPGWQAKARELTREKDALEESLKMHGFDPDPAANMPQALLKRACEVFGVDPPAKPATRKLPADMLFMALSQVDMPAEAVRADMQRHWPRVLQGLGLDEQAKEAYGKYLQSVGLERLAGVRKSRPFYKLLMLFMDLKDRGVQDPAVVACALKQAYEIAGGWEDAGRSRRRASSCRRTCSSWWTCTSWSWRRRPRRASSRSARTRCGA